MLLKDYKGKGIRSEEFTSAFGSPLIPSNTFKQRADNSGWREDTRPTNMLGVVLSASPMRRPIMIYKERD